MKVNYIITTYGDLSLASSTTLDSIKANLKDGDKITDLSYMTRTEEEVINEYISSLKEGEFTHIMIINDGSTLKDYSSTVLDTYVDNDSTVYLPMIELCNEDKGKVSFKGFLNSSIWKPYFAQEVGTLDQTLSLRGVDLILYGALIPLSVVQKHKFKPEIKYYSFFEFLSRIIYSNTSVQGIPKVTLKCIKDYELKEVPKEEKINFFTQATSVYMVE